MGYYVRAFCTKANVPDLASIQTWLRERKSPAVIDDPHHACEAAKNSESNSSVLDLTVSDWEQVAIAYRTGKLPILAECNRRDGSDDDLVREEVAEFIEFIGEPGRSATKRRVLEHLGAALLGSSSPVSYQPLTSRMMGMTQTPSFWGSSSATAEE
jgi:hypothetical protein